MSEVQNLRHVGMCSEVQDVPISPPRYRPPSKAYVITAGNVNLTALMPHSKTSPAAPPPLSPARHGASCTLIRFCIAQLRFLPSHCRHSYRNAAAPPYSHAHSICMNGKTLDRADEMAGKIGLLQDETTVSPKSSRTSASGLHLNAVLPPHHLPLPPTSPPAEVMPQSIASTPSSLPAP